MSPTRRPARLVLLLPALALAPAVAAQHTDLSPLQLRAQPPSALAPFVEVIKIPSPGAAQGLGTSFGYSLDVDGDTAVVGAGTVYVYEKGTSWATATLVATLTSGAFGSGTNYTVAIDGDTIVTTGGDAQAAFLFEKPATGWVDMSHTAVLTASNMRGIEFGVFTAVDGDTVVVGAPGQDFDPFPGAVYVFEKPPTGWVDMTETAILTASDGIASDDLGFTVAIDGDTIAAASPNQWGLFEPGAVYVFEKPASGWVDATETAKLLASGGPEWNGMGSSLVMRGDTVLAGAPRAGGTVGAAYLFEKPPQGWVNATETAALTAANPQGAEFTGTSVALDGGRAIVGAPGGVLTPLVGMAYVFDQPTTGWADANESTTITPSDGFVGQWFGFSMAMTDDAVCVGGPFPQTLLSGVWVYEQPVATAGTGCGLPGVAVTGVGRLGGTLTFSMPSCVTGSTHALFLGTPFATPVGLAMPPRCADVVACSVSCKPVLVLPGPTAPFTLPISTSFVGVPFCAQGACIDPASCPGVTDMVELVVGG